MNDSDFDFYVNISGFRNTFKSFAVEITHSHGSQRCQDDPIFSQHCFEILGVGDCIALIAVWFTERDMLSERGLWKQAVGDDLYYWYDDNRCGDSDPSGQGAVLEKDRHSSCEGSQRKQGE